MRPKPSDTPRQHSRRVATHLRTEGNRWCYNGGMVSRQRCGNFGLRQAPPRYGADFFLTPFIYHPKMGNCRHLTTMLLSPPHRCCRKNSHRRVPLATKRPMQSPKWRPENLPRQNLRVKPNVAGPSKRLRHWLQMFHSLTTVSHENVRENALTRNVHTNYVFNQLYLTTMSRSRRNLAGGKQRWNDKKGHTTRVRLLTM